MSLATSIKDYWDVLNEISISRGLTGELPILVLLQQTTLFVGKNLISLVVYLLSFQWLRDISYLPLLTPQIDGLSLLGNNWLDNPTSHIFSFSSVPKQATDQLLAGFANSFFFSLPVSLPHLVSLRCFFIQGAAAAVASVMGIVVAHSLFLVGILYGLRFLIVPYLCFEPINYIVGLVLVAILVKDLVKQKVFRPIPLWDTRSFFKIGSFTFLLTWCEESSLFHPLNNLTLNAHNTYFDLYPSSSAFDSFVVHTTYILAFFLGHSVFSALFYFVILKSIQLFAYYRRVVFVRITLQLSKFLPALIVAYTLCSFPYYGIDYLVGNITGFLPEDPAYNNSVLSPSSVKTKFPHLFKEILPHDRNAATTLNLDLSSFDRGMYLNAPVQEKQKVLSNASTNTAASATYTFEELNYQGEYAWVMRDQVMKDSTKSKKNVLNPLFKDYKQKARRMRERNDSRVQDSAQNAYRRRRGREGSSTDETVLAGATQSSVAQPKEGVLPADRPHLFIKMTDFIGKRYLLPQQVDFEKLNHVNHNSVSSQSAFSRTGANDSLFESQLSDQSNSDDDDSLSSGKTLSPKRLLESPTISKIKRRDPLKEELVLEQKVKRAYSKGFAPPFSIVYDRTRAHFLPTKNSIRKKYVLNPVYRSLLSIDIDTFLARQPAAYKLAANQEFQLFEKRQILQKYYNWLRYYQPFEQMLKFRFRIPDTKSFVDRVYHQQFKGTLRVARRFFKVTFDSQQNPNRDRVLSYDQMLYSELAPGENPYMHEELAKQEPDSAVSATGADNQTVCRSCQPFVEESSSSPTYAGWDPTLRRFVVTNRFAVKTVG